MTPAEAAQDVADRLVRAGVKAILNFAPVQISVPHDVHVKSVNMALELEALSNKHFSFITEEYLPKKLAAKQWLD